MVVPAYAGVILITYNWTVEDFGLSRVCGVINISFPGNASDNHDF